MSNLTTLLPRNTFRKSDVWALLAGLLLALAAPPAATAQGTVPVDDAYVTAKKATRNFGADPILAVGPADRTFLRFVSNLPPGTPGSHVGKATVKLFVTSVTTPGPITLLRVSSNWSEASVTNVAAPAIAEQVGTIRIDPDSASRWVTADITPLVRAWLDNASPNQGIALVPMG